MNTCPDPNHELFLQLADEGRLQEAQEARDLCEREQTSTCCLKHWEEACTHHALFTPQGIAWIPASRPFITCTVCGNKRCPRATDCSLPCTNSNEPNQEGSVY